VLGLVPPINKSNPFEANLIAIERPIPLEAPVITATGLDMAQSWIIIIQLPKKD